ncbi:hypothetical protein YPPY47_1175, partial [Yersinia pestis PY-47]
MARGNSET